MAEYHMRLATRLDLNHAKHNYLHLYGVRSTDTSASVAQCVSVIVFQPAAI